MGELHTIASNGNLNVIPDIGSSGIDFCNDTTHTDNYLHINTILTLYVTRV